MLGTVPTDRKGKPLVPKSGYQPGKEILDLTLTIKRAYEDGQANHDAPRDEYNGMSLTERTNESNRRWLAHPDTPYEGEDDWRFSGVPPMTRNRIIFTAARMTSQLLYPKNFAQNTEQEEDREAAYVMDTLVEHVIRNSNYDMAFLFGVIGAMCNPVIYMDVRYCEDYQEAWVNGKRERVIDDMFSGFQYSLLPTDEILFESMFVFEYQQQEWIIHKKRASYEEMEGKYGDHANWQHVQEGRMVLPGDDGYFYDVDDIENDGLVGYACYKHRKSDTEIPFVNGIYLGNSNPAYNPFYHRRYNDKGQDVPVYNQVKMGYEPIDTMRFYGFMDLCQKMENDQDAATREWQDYFDASRLATFAPLVTMGAGKIDKSVVSPAGVTDLGDKDAKALPLNIANPNAARMAFQEAKESGNETSIDPQSAGKKQGPQQTKAETLLLERNTDTGLGITAKLIGRTVKDIGALTNDNILRYMTVGEAGELLGEMTYKSYLVDRVKEGKKQTTQIRFSDRYAGASMSKEEKEMEEYKLMDEYGADSELFFVNPGPFVRLRFSTVVDPDQLMQRNDAFERTFKLSVYDRAIADPLIQQDMEAHSKITRDFLLEPLVKGDAAKYMPNIKKIAEQITPAAGQSGRPSKSTPASTVRQLAAAGMV